MTGQDSDTGATEISFSLASIPFDRYAHKNPAFTAVVLHAVAHGYEKRKGKGLAIPWAILAIPYIAAEGVRAAIPTSWNGSLSVLLDRHPQWQAQNAEAMVSAAKFFWPGLRLGVSRGILQVENGRIRATGVLQPNEPGEARDTYIIADKFGRFLGKEPEETLPTLFNLEVIQ